MIQIQNLTKNYGAFTALKGINLQIKDQQIFGLLGPNGAGKTTLLRALATLLTPSAGQIEIAGYNTQQNPEDIRRLIGVVNGGMGLPAKLNGREILQSYASFYDMHPTAINERITQLDETLELGRILDTPASELSTGMKQKIIIARAVIHDPQLLILDEAASGLDIFARRILLDFVQSTRAPNKLTIYSTHVMSEAEEVCDQVAILHQGKLLGLGKITDVLAQTNENNLEKAFFTLIQQGATHEK